MAWWPVERWEALRLALGARGALPREVGTLIPPQGCPLVPWRLPPLHPLARFARNCKPRTHCAARTRKRGCLKIEFELGAVPAYPLAGRGKEERCFAQRPDTNHDGCLAATNVARMQ